jgi:outer membrane immunogenic protein
LRRGLVDLSSGEGGDMTRRFVQSSFAAVAMLAAAVLSAQAADLPPAYKAAPVVAPVYNWTGFYLSAGGGYGMWSADTTTIEPLTGACDLCVTQTQGGRGYFATVGGGFDYQFTDHIVAGVLADADFSNIKGTIQDQTPFFAGTIKEKWSWAAGARVGWLVVPALLSYVNGGYTQTHFDGATMVDTITGLSTPFTTPSFSRGGWFMGGGVESNFAPGWFWKTEYRYADYGTTNLTDSVPGGGPVIVVPGVGAFANPQDTITFHPIVQTIRSELIYKFNWGR